MATINFKLKDKTSKELIPINYYISLSRGNRLRGGTSFSINPKHWNEDNQEVRNMAEVSKKRKEINKWLRCFETFTLDTIDELKAENLDQDKIKTTLKERIKEYQNKTKKAAPIDISFYPFLERFKEQSKGRIIEKTGKPISIRTIQDYKTVLDHIKDFETKEDYKITFDTINLDFYYAFKDYLEDKDYALNTIGKYFKVIKVFMNEATERGVNINLAYKSKHFVKPTEKSEQIYLNEKELKDIIDLDLSENEQLDNARDLFIIGAYTGLRVSDFNGLTKDNIHEHKGVRVFRLYQQKTNTYLPIPIHPIVEKILKKRDGNPPNKMPSQKINDLLEAIGEDAEINEIITTKSTKGGKIISKMTPKNKMIKNHTARRSFCTNAYLSKMSTLDIMAISGHQSEKTFLNYIKVSKDERAIKIADSDFFKPKSELKVV
jgi:integrase